MTDLRRSAAAPARARWGTVGHGGALGLCGAGDELLYVTDLVSPRAQPNGSRKIEIKIRCRIFVAALESS